MIQDMLNAFADNACFERDGDGIGTFSVELHCVDYEVTVKYLKPGFWTDDVWTPGQWELISFKQAEG
jgi:hypothetical protein